MVPGIIRAKWICTDIRMVVPFDMFLIRQIQLFQMIVSDEFLKQCDTEALLKFNSCFSTEFAH